MREECKFLSKKLKAFEAQAGMRFYLVLNDVHTQLSIVEIAQWFSRKIKLKINKINCNRNNGLTSMNSFSNIFFVLNENQFHYYVNVVIMSKIAFN